MEFAPSNANIAYVLTDNGVFRSTNNGGSWSPMTSTTYYGRCLAVHPTNPNTVFMGTWGRGVMKSTNSGASWVEANTGMPVDSLIDVDYVAAHPAQSGKVYCHLRGNGLYESDDFGMNWSFLHPLSSLYMDSLFIHPDDPSVMMYTWYEMFRSTDGGGSWQRILSSPGDERYKAIRMDPHRDRVWLLDSHYNDSLSRILFSDNQGKGWQALANPPGNPPLDQYNDIAIDPFDQNLILVAAAPKWSSMMENGWLFRSDDGGTSWTRIKEGLELRNWNITAGQWYVQSNHLTQYAINTCSVRASIRDLVTHDGTYEMRTRVTAVENGDTNRWCGMSICLPTLQSAWNDGVLVGMRRNNDCFLWAGGETKVDAPAAVSNAGNYQTIGVRVEGNTYTLRINGSDVGSWTDTAAQYGSGYVCVATCRARADFDDITVTGSQSFSDDFNIGNWGNGYSLSTVQFSPYEPGVVYLKGGEGVYRSEDSGLSWSRITTSADESFYFYSMLMSKHPSANVYMTKGTFYPPTFITGAFSQNGTVFDQLGETSNGYYRSPIAEDALQPNILYTGQYGPGFEVYIGDVPGTSGVEGSWLFLR
jgi:photosystem II stability/assembly factor-like uncharacterized protein